MATEERELSNGWPLGLEIITMRLQVGESSQAAPAEAPHSLHIPSSSFTSFSSSNLDTESTASFFQDHSVSLGKLIGLRPIDRGRLYLANSIHCEKRETRSLKAVYSDISKRQKAEMAQGICLPLLLGALVKIGCSKSR